MAAARPIRRAFDVQERVGDRWVNRLSGTIGRMITLRGGEKIIADRLVGVSTVVIRLRASSVRDITTDWRLKDSESRAVYDIKSIAPEGREYINITCQCEHG